MAFVNRPLIVRVVGWSAQLIEKTSHVCEFLVSIFRKRKIFVVNNITKYPGVQ